MPVAPPTRRRWFRFGLRLWLLLTAAVALFLAYHIHWIRARRALLAEENQKLTADEIPAHPPSGKVRAPGLLWLFGEPGVDDFCFWFDGRNHDWSLIEGEQAARTERAKELFPEATIYGCGVEYEDASREHGELRVIQLFEEPAY